MPMASHVLSPPHAGPRLTTRIGHTARAYTAGTTRSRQSDGHAISGLPGESYLYRIFKEPYSERGRPMITMTRSFGLLAIAVSILASPALHAEGEHHWSYSGDTGPPRWSALEADYKECGLGKLQSPIDIRDGVAKKGALPIIAFDYKPSPLTIIDNGHTVQVDYAPGSFITVQGKRYELVQFHFHKPSEEKINGKSADMFAWSRSARCHPDRNGRCPAVARDSA